eukprot:m.448081 g.448081  ORF g.448081 m.448081 type:complete len:73 (-) comp19609_c0_seq1:8-226(-)
MGTGSGCQSTSPYLVVCGVPYISKYSPRNVGVMFALARRYGFFVFMGGTAVAATAKDIQAIMAIPRVRILGG